VESDADARDDADGGRRSIVVPGIERALSRRQDEGQFNLA
jgi:hypothetical protein